MPITSLDHLHKRFTNNFTYKSNFIWNCGAPNTGSNLGAGRTFDCFFSGTIGSGTNFRGLSGENTYPATNGARTWVSCNSSSSFSIGLPPANNVASNETIHITSASAITSSSTAVPSFFTLLDLQGYWPNVSATTLSTQNFSGTPGSTLRYANGAGCRLYLIQNEAIVGGTTPLVQTLSYTNQGGTTGRNAASAFTIKINDTVSVARNGCIVHAAQGTCTSNTPGMFLPLAGNDTGVQNVASITLTDTPTPPTAGSMTLCLARPILQIPVIARSVFADQDFIIQLPILPEVKSDACLVLTYTNINTTANNTAFYGQLEFVWG
jgi:hypothetical protein